MGVHLKGGSFWGLKICEVVSQPDDLEREEEKGIGN